MQQHIQTTNIFIIRRSELLNRLEAEYYRPDLYKIERLVKSKATKRLKDFILKIASGATPNVVEEEKYYGTKDTGVPFLRVQNLQTSGKLNLDDVKYINYETHEGYLKRSQVSEHDLLVKITGVGRMAIASVAPQNFIGNTNQHMVVIKTQNKEISEYLSKYLNLDIIEKLASKRSTGATRPALDYSALKSIPVIEGLDFTSLDIAEEIKAQKVTDALKLFERIDFYIFNELGIIISKQNNELRKRIFTSRFSDVVGLRLDPFYFNHSKSSLQSNLYKEVSLKSIANITKGQSITKDKVEDGPYPVIAGGQTSPYCHNQYNQDENVITVSASGAYAGYVWYHTQKIFASDCSVIRSKKEREISTEFIYNVLKARQSEIYRLQQGAGQPHVYPRDLAKLKIPIPPPEKQKEINEKIRELKNRASTLQMEGQLALENAKKKIEEVILRNI